MLVRVSGKDWTEQIIGGNERRVIMREGFLITCEFHSLVVGDLVGHEDEHDSNIAIIEPVTKIERWGA